MTRKQRARKAHRQRVAARVETNAKATNVNAAIVAAASESSNWGAAFRRALRMG